MKKVFMLLAVAGMMSFAACNNNKNAAEPIAEVEAIENVADEIVDESNVEEIATECDGAAETEATKVAE